MSRMEILYNVTVKIEHDAHQSWLEWMETIHLPAIMTTGLFREYRMSRLMGVDESDGVTYSIQFLAPDREAYVKYQAEHAGRLQAAHHDRYKDRYVVFRTLMTVVSSSK